MPTSPLVPLTLVSSRFEGQVLVARLGAEGIVAAVRGGESPYPLPGPVEVLVEADRAGDARELLAADADPDAPPGDPPG